MRIAIFAETFLPKWDGVANTTCHLLEHLQRRGHTTLMFAPEGAPPEYAGARIIGLPSYPFPFYPDLRLTLPFFDVSVEHQLRAFCPDVVHLINPASLGLAGLGLAKTLHVPIVASYHTDIPGYAELYGMGLFREPLWAYFRWLHNQAALNYCPSQFTRQQLETHGFERLKVWGRGVDTERFHPRYRNPVWRARMTEGHSVAPLLLYVGRLAVEKRVEWLLPLLKALPQARLAVVGDGPQRKELESRFAGTPTVFLGYLKGQDLQHAYAAADLFVFPSASETFGNVVLEAMAAGLPVVAARAGGPVDHVHDGVNGFLCDPDTPDEMIALAQLCLRDRTYLWQLAAQARAYAETQQWETILDAVLEDYKTLASNAPYADGQTLTAADLPLLKVAAHVEKHQ